jgi:hypothetical protein
MTKTVPNGSWHTWTLDDNLKSDRICISISRLFFVLSSAVYWFYTIKKFNLVITLPLCILWLIAILISIAWSLGKVFKFPILNTLISCLPTICQVIVCIILGTSLKDRCTPYVLSFLIVLVIVEASNLKSMLAALSIGAVLIFTVPVAKHEVIAIIVCLIDLTFMIIFKTLFASNIEPRKYMKAKSALEQVPDENDSSRKQNLDIGDSSPPIGATASLEDQIIQNKKKILKNTILRSRLSFNG